MCKLAFVEVLELDGLLQIDLARSGLDNMSLDQAMLEQTALDSIPRMRIYQWKEPTVSLGYFQKFEDFQRIEDLRGLPIVRRATGGGAIVHHFDWTYSIAVPSREIGALGHGASTKLYNCLHQAVVLWLENLRVTAQLWSEPLQPNPPQAGNCSSTGCSFLCFERRHQGDVVSRGAKVMGSAQRRLGRGLLQHGSLLLRTSPFAKSLPGLADLAPMFDTRSETELPGFVDQLRLALGTELSIQFQPSEWVTSVLPEMARARVRFESSDWTSRI